MIKRTIIFLLIILLVSCGKRNSSAVLKPAEMQDVLWDILRADAFTNTYQKRDSTKIPAEENVKLQKQVFLIHNTSKEQFYSSYAFYEDHPDMMKTILDSIISKANRERPVLVRPVKNIVKDTTAAKPVIHK